MSGIDIALWDILGKSLNAPVWRLLGGRKAERMPIYASGGWADAKGIGKQLMGYVKKGNVSAVKMRVGNCANTEGIFRIIQSVPSPKAEPFKRWLAQVGYERVKEIENPELASISDTVLRYIICFISGNRL